LSGTAITEIRYSTSSLQPAHGKIRTLNSQVNPAEVDIINGGTTVADVDYISSAKIGDYSLRAKVNTGTASISNLSDITSISHVDSPTTKPGNYLIKAKVNTGTASISNLTSTAIDEIRHDASTESVPVPPGDYTVSVTQDKRDYRLMLRSSNGNIELEKTSNGTTWTSASSDTVSADSISQGSSFTFQTADNKPVTVTFPDSDSDGVLDFKDDYPNNVNKVKDLPAAFSSLSSNLRLWLDSREWSAIETNGTNTSNWIDFSGKANHIDQSTTSETLSIATMFVVTKSGAQTQTLLLYLMSHW
jgi:hypothetical protein